MIKSYIYSLIASEISKFSKYYDQLVQLNPLKHDSGILFNNIIAAKKNIVKDANSLNLTSEKTERTIVLLNGNLNYSLDVQELLNNIYHKVSNTTRIVIIAYNPYYKIIYHLLNLLRLRKSPLPTTFLTENSINHLSQLAGFDLVKKHLIGYFPFRLFRLGDFVNKTLILIPIIKYLAFTQMIILKRRKRIREIPTLSIIIPAKNEEGNIENGIKRLIPYFKKETTEVIFVEGHSTDNTWNEIQRVMKSYSNILKISAYRQTGRGKIDAVRLGFSKASFELLTILDADLSTPPEQLVRFFDAFCFGKSDFINGNRLVYPHEDGAMRPLNKFANLFFAKALSYILDIPIGDSLCGTKLIAKHDYNRIIKWREDFGDFDPFGDFELLFAASILGLNVLDIPIHYKARKYGSTNIRRFYHGIILLKMTLIGFFKIKIGL